MGAVPALLDGTANLPRLINDLSHQLFNLITGLMRFAGQLPHFIRNYSKATTGLTCPRRFNGGIEGQQIGLVGNFLNAGDQLIDGVRSAIQYRSHRSALCCIFTDLTGTLVQIG